MDYILTTYDLKRARVGDIRLRIVALPVTKRTSSVMQAWSESVISAYKAAPDEPTLRGIVWEIGDEDPADLRRLYLLVRRRVAGVRWWLVGASTKVSTARADSRVTGVDQETLHRTLQAVSPADLEASILATQWPTLEDPAKGGGGRRITSGAGNGRVVPWDMVITETAPAEKPVLDKDGRPTRDAYGMLVTTTDD